ncbi:hypothetical protein KQX54_009763 [Cotesia glomerata]|uniref:Uncharacterized protein n=1 Tax=Cotesia glomerata TaxID=32391 RepID=A0AAV7IM76_COTGL|nr:hypothetical protein KQX54_009763 [Cotesia glomerata]
MPSNATPILCIYLHIRIHIHISSRTTGCGSFNGAKQVLSVGNRAKLTLVVGPPSIYILEDGFLMASSKHFDQGLRPFWVLAIDRFDFERQCGSCETINPGLASRGRLPGKSSMRCQINWKDRSTEEWVACKTGGSWHDNFRSQYGHITLEIQRLAALSTPDLFPVYIDMCTNYNGNNTCILSRIVHSICSSFFGILFIALPARSSRKSLGCHEGDCPGGLFGYSHDVEAFLVYQYGIFSLPKLLGTLRGENKLQYFSSGLLKTPKHHTPKPYNFEDPSV